MAETCRTPPRPRKSPRSTIRCLTVGGNRSDIRDPAALDTELGRVQVDYNTVRLHAGIDYATPDDEHHGRGPAIRRVRAAGLKRAHEARIAHSRKQRPGSTS